MHYEWNNREHFFCRLPVNYNAQTKNNNMNAEGLALHWIYLLWNIFFYSLLWTWQFWKESVFFLTMETQIKCF